ncbi:hypothetical protein ACWF94_36235 [Streptomyces sp. NPDC055078]
MTTAHPGALVAGSCLRHLRQTRRLTLDHVAGLARFSMRTVNAQTGAGPRPGTRALPPDRPVRSRSLL